MKNLVIMACLLAAGYAIYQKVYGTKPGGGAEVAQAGAPGPGGASADQLPVLIMSAEASESLASISSTRVVLFSAAWCPHCKTVRNLLNRQGVRFTELDVERNERAAAYQREKLPVAGFPVTIIGNKIVMGADEGQILAALKSL